MSKQILFDSAKGEYQMYMETGRKVFKESALKYYNRYKSLKGKKIIKGLEI